MSAPKEYVSTVVYSSVGDPWQVGADPDLDPTLDPILFFSDITDGKKLFFHFSCKLPSGTISSVL
jgi:hypothetical protein